MFSAPVKKETHTILEEWYQREREKIKSRMTKTTNPDLLKYYRKELKVIAEKVLLLNFKSPRNH